MFDILVNLRFIVSPSKVLLGLLLYDPIVRLVEIRQIIFTQKHLARLILLLGVSHEDLEFIHRLLRSSVSTRLRFSDDLHWYKA